MATLGVLINHYDARNDIRDLVEHMSREHKIILLGPAASISSSIKLPKGVEFRPIQSRQSFYHWIIAQLYRHLGFIPKSRDNFYINEIFKLGKLSFARKTLAKISLAIRMYTPVRINPETYLKLIKNCDRTHLEDIDGFLLITEFSDNALTARIIDSGKPHCAYVYSWDHPCKHTVMSARIKNYAVWNDYLANDMNELQGIDPHSCKIIGATQLVPINHFLKHAGPARCGEIEGRPYFYFGCGVGPIELARQEMEIVRKLALVIKKSAPNCLLLVRPYPISQGVNLRPMLAGLDNVRWDDHFKNHQQGRSLNTSDIDERLTLQRGAKAFFHIGTTMGFEGAFLDVPCILLQPPADGEGASEFNQLKEFSNQYHLQKHMMGLGNTFRINDNLEKLISRCLTNDSIFDQENKRVVGGTPLKSMSEIAQQLLQLSLDSADKIEKN